MLDNRNIILVTGVTGSQGYAVAETLLKNGNTVRIMVRRSSADNEQVKNLTKLGASVVVADMDQRQSLEIAMSDVYGLFSVQAMDNGTDSERRHADVLVDVALQKGVSHVVHASVSGIDSYINSPGWKTGIWNEKYWTDKHYAENKVRATGFKYWTILRPTFFMDNFIIPKVQGMYPGLDEGKLTVVFKPDKKLQFIDVGDTGKFACAAFNDPNRFNKQSIELVGDILTIDEIADIIGEIIQSKIEIKYVTESEAVKAGIFRELANFQEWTNQAGFSVNKEALKKYDISLTTFEQFARKNGHLFPLNKKRNRPVK